MKRIFLFLIKSIFLVLILIISHLTITYCVEQLELVSITPLSISDVRDSHISNILAPFPFIVIWMGWVYYLAFFAYHKTIETGFRSSGFLLQAGIGMIISISFFLFWWIFIELMDLEILLEGLIVYPILGIILTLLYRVLFGYKNYNYS